MNDIKTVSRMLLMQYWTAVIAAITLVVVYECGMIDSGTLSHSRLTEYYLLLVMEPLTLAGIFGALYMFKLRRIDGDLKSRGAVALKQWATLRIAILEVLLLGNTIFYYLFMAASFGYMAIMVALAYCFVYPNLSRCKADIEK
jgi:hypothetical protein